jgi:6-phosphogluconolactonase (cycloisomerase 2 family)
VGSEYNGSNGDVIDAKFIANVGANFVLIGPTGLAVWGKFFFVAGTGNQAIFRYDAATGANGIMWPETPTQFALGNPTALAVSADGKTLFVAHWQEGGTLFDNSGHGSVSTYNANSGTVDKDNLILGLDFPTALAVSADGKTLFVGNSGGTTGVGSVGAYSATSGDPIKGNLITGLPSVYGIAVLDNTLYVASYYGSLSKVGTYSATSGDPIKANLITGLNQAYGVAIKPAATP